MASATTNGKEIGRNPQARFGLPVARAPLLCCRSWTILGIAGVADASQLHLRHR